MTGTPHRTHHRIAVAVVVVGWAAAASWTAADARSDAPTPAGLCEQRYGPTVTGSQDDLDGDHCADLVVGLPARPSLDGTSSAGRIVVQYGVDLAGRAAATVLDEKSFGRTPATGDRFGAAITYPHVDADSAATDLAVAAPGADGGTGAVLVARGGADGVQTDDPLRLTGRSAGEHFGAAIAANGQDLWVGAPDRAVAGQPGAGAVDHYRLGTDGTADLVETLHQGADGIYGAPEAGDHFGAVLATDAAGTLVVGIPDEDVARAGANRKDAGIVTAIWTSSDTHRLTATPSITQESNFVYSSSETGDRFGAALSLNRDGTRLAVGAPGEGIHVAGNVPGAGAAYLFYVAGENVFFELSHATQQTQTVTSRAEPYDHFGASVALGVFVPDDPENPDLDMAVGSPGEDVGTAADAGSVSMLRYGENPYRPSSRKTLVQVYPLIVRGGNGDYALPGRPTTGDQVGAGFLRLGRPDVGPSDDGLEGAKGGGSIFGIDAAGQEPGHPGVLHLVESDAAPVRGSSGDRLGVLPTTVDNGPTYVDDAP